MGFFKEEDEEPKDKEEECQKLLRSVKDGTYISKVDSPDTEPSEFLEAIKNVLSSKKFWIAVVVVLLIYNAYKMGVDSATPMTKQEKQEAITMCARVSGKVIYDENGEYSDCLESYYNR